MNKQQHEMILEKTYPSGVDEWYCPTCGRRMLMNYRPKFEKTVLEAGDEYATHNGGKGGLQIGSIQAMPVDSSSKREGAEVGDARLAPWAAWLDESGFEDLWNSDDQ